MTTLIVLGCTVVVALLAIAVRAEVVARRHRQDDLPRGVPTLFATGDDAMRVPGPDPLSDPPDILPDDALPDMPLPFDVKGNSKVPHDAVWLKERVRVLEGEGKSIIEALTIVVSELDVEQDINAMVGLCSEARYSAADLAKALAANRYTVEDIAEAFQRRYELSPEDWVATLWPIAEGETALEKIRSVAKSIEAAEGAQWDDGSYGDTDPIDLIQPFLTAGCTLPDVVRLLYGESDLRFAAIVKGIPDTMLPKVADAAALAGTSCISIVDEDECGALVEELDYTMTSLVEFYASSSVPVASLINLLSSQRMADDLPELIEVLVAWYPAWDVFQALYDETDWTTAAIADAALDCGAIAWDDVIAFLRASVGDDLDDFEDELIEEDVVFERRIRILYALLPPQQAALPESE